MKTADQHDEQTRHALQAFINERGRAVKPRPTQAELEAACKAGRAEYDAGNVAITPQFICAITTAPHGWTQIDGGTEQGFSGHCPTCGQADKGAQ